MINREAIDELKFLHQKLYNGIFKNKTGCLDYAIKALEELEAYHKSEEQGLLLRLPCKVGSTVWCERQYKGLQPYQITNIMISQNKKGVWTRKYRAMRIHNGKTVDDQLNFSFDNIGKTVFLTEEEAEEALQKMRGGSDE